MMENTCKPESCKLHALLGREPSECPHYIETWWTPAGPDGQRRPVLVQDCAPKRILIMVQDLSNRLVGVQQAHEEQRNQVAGLIEGLTCMMQARFLIEE